MLWGDSRRTRKAAPHGHESAKKLRGHASRCSGTSIADHSAMAATQRQVFTAATALGAGLMMWRRRARRFSFRDRVVIITGGARGFGLALAQRLAPERPRLVPVSRTLAELARARADLAACGAIVDVYVCDIRDRHAVEQVVASVA